MTEANRGRGAAAEGTRAGATTPDATAPDADATTTSDATAPDATTTSDAPTPDASPPAQRPQRPAVLVFTQAVLALQALAALFATLLVSGLDKAGSVSVPAGVTWGAGLGLVVLLGYASGQQKKRWGRWLGWILQLPMLVAAIIDPAIAIIGFMFLGLWIMALQIGGRIDRERAERLEAARETHAASSEGASS
jgi:hypothetical protein